jgi:hypothetical protein
LSYGEGDPQGVAPERRSKADTTGLAPKKSALNPLVAIAVRGFGFLVRFACISLVKSLSGGLG